MNQEGKFGEKMKMGCLLKKRSNKRKLVILYFLFMINNIKLVINRVINENRY